MSGPGWLAGCFAALMIAVAAYCAYRLALSRLRGRRTEVDVDGVHVLMGAAMAGMLEPRLSPIPGTAWLTVFAAAAAWFGWQAMRAGGRGGSAHPALHVAECTAMIYMLVPVGSWPTDHGPGMAMPGMSQGATPGNPALTLVFALFMLGYVLWTIDRLAWLSRTGAAATPHGSAAVSPSRGMVTVPALAPRLAACYKIIMAIAMGYMLVTML